jgi:hypothetical protein
MRSGIAIVGSPTLISEIAYPKHRESVLSHTHILELGRSDRCYYRLLYKKNGIKSCYSWRILSNLQDVFPLTQLIIIWWIPESPCYIVIKTKLHKAQDVINKFHTWNSVEQRELDFVQFELREIQAGLEAEKTSGSNINYSDFITRKSC